MTGAECGSTVVVEDLQDGSVAAYTLTAGAAVDIDAGQVSLVSPVGQALLGAKPGSVVLARTPYRERRLRVLEIRSLSGHLAAAPPLPAA